jgi:hypothetical protein
MGFLAPTPPPYDPIAWSKLPFAERARMVCEAWAMQGYGTPLAVFLVYAVKIALFVGGWVVACRFSAGSGGLGGLSTIGSWWLAPVAFEKAIVWSLLFEVLGLGCGSGPLTGRYFPPVGGFLYFLRRGTTKLPLFPKAGILGGRTRDVTDVLLYLLLLVSCLRTLVAPSLDPGLLVPIVASLAVLGVLDKTIFLAARGEHYWVVLVCCAYAPSTTSFLACAKAVQLALWFWAGVSKLNHHFPTVVCVMTSNGPFTRFAWLRRRMYRSYPDDLRPSTLAVVMSHMGTALEVGVPIAFLVTPLGTRPVVAIALMLALHGYITSNVPVAVPLEWNVLVVYGAFALFWAHPDVSLLAVQSPTLAAFLVVMLLAVPLLGNLFPARVSFLLAMRYYAGNWPYSVWLFRGESHRKLGALKKSSPWIYDQLDRFYDRSTGVGLVSKVLGFRLMHLHGRALPLLVPKAVDRLEEYEWLDGELVAGLALGWNFGDGHLHNEHLLEAIQAQCAFDEGELRCIFVEPQPLFGKSLAYRIVDAKTGRLEAGELAVSELRTRQPWERGPRQDGTSPAPPGRGPHQRAVA